jgi:Stigma-specific protein, Stig1
VSQQTTGRSFDELARALASGILSRGKALRLMGGLLVGGTLGSIPGVAWANDRCSEGQTRCGDRCVNLKTNERHCGSCRSRCASNQTCCKGRCVNLQISERDCGRCSNRCAEGQECVRGLCQGGCPSGTTECGGNCVCNCLSGQTLNPSTCQCEAVGCATSEDPCAVRAPCCPNSECICFRTTEGGTTCFTPTLVCEPRGAGVR